jgi:hypothetical protein
MNTRTITAAALAASMLFQAQGFTQDAVLSGTSAAPASADPEALARENWRLFIAKNPAPEKGCFHVSYPNVIWEVAACKDAQLRSHPTRVRRPADVPDVAEGGKDYAAVAQGLITSAVGSFVENDVGSVTSIGGSGGVTGSNEYSLQLNTNFSTSSSPAICSGHSGSCTVWQQFVYATDNDVSLSFSFPFVTTEAGLYIQYWLLGWNASCPSGWQSHSQDGQTDCYKNSSMASLPDIPITELNHLGLTGFASPGSMDVVTLTNGAEAWSVYADDSVLDIGSAWTEAEFNVVGDGGSSEAQFNAGSSITVQLAIADGSASAPACLPGGGTTGESNNLNLGSCQVDAYGASGLSSTDPFVYRYAIEFAESLPSTPPRPLCLPPATMIDGKCTPKGGLPQ